MCSGVRGFGIANKGTGSALARRIQLDVTCKGKAIRKAKASLKGAASLRIESFGTSQLPHAKQGPIYAASPGTSSHQNTDDEALSTFLRIVLFRPSLYWTKLNWGLCHAPDVACW